MKLIILILNTFLMSNIGLASNGIGLSRKVKKRKSPEDYLIGTFSRISIGNLSTLEELELENRFESAREVIEGGYAEQFQDVIGIVQNNPQVLKHADSQDKKTLLMLAAQHGATELLEVFINLIEEDTLLACDQDGCNALYLADLNDHQDAIKIIRQHEAYEKTSRQRKRMRR